MAHIPFKAKYLQILRSHKAKIVHYEFFEVH